MVPPLSILLTENTWSPSRPSDSGPLMTILGPADLFVLAIAAIGHDVGHPGFTNLFMANAAAPLSAVFDGKSPLEQMHCALLLRVMRAHGLGRLLDGGSRTRRLLLDTVLATDMRVHDAFMQRFADLLARRGDTSLAYRRTTLCQAIIKCADISNPVSGPLFLLVLILTPASAEPPVLHLTALGVGPAAGVERAGSVRASPPAPGNC